MAIQPSMPQSYFGMANVQSAKSSKVETKPEAFSPPEKTEAMTQKQVVVHLPPEIPSPTPAMTNLANLGTKLINLPTPAKTEDVEKENRLEKTENVVEHGGETMEVSAKVMVAVDENPALPELSKVDLSVMAAFLEDTASGAQILMIVLKINEQTEMIDHAKSEVSAKTKEMQNLAGELDKAKKEGNADKVATLEKSVKKLTTEIKEHNHIIQKGEKEKEVLKKDFVGIVVKTGLVSLKGVTEVVEKFKELADVAQTGTEVVKNVQSAHQVVRLGMPLAQEAGQEAGSAGVQALPVLGAIAGSLLSLLTLALSSKALMHNKGVAQEIEKEKKQVLTDMETFKDNPIVTKVLSFRLQSLDQQTQNNAVSTVKNAFSEAAGILGTAVSAKALAVAVGATVSAPLGTAVAATGIGAIVLGTGGLVIGLGYLAYKNRHAIENSLENANISRKEYLENRKIDQLQKAKTVLYETYVTSTKGYEKTKAFEEGSEGSEAISEKLDNIFREQIDEIQDEIIQINAKIEGLKGNFLNKFKIIKLERQIEADRQEIQSIAQQKTKIAMQRAETQATLFHSAEASLDELRQTDLKIINAANDLIELNKVRNIFNDRYIYGQDVAKFAADADGEEVTWQTLKEAHDSLYEAVMENPESLEILQKYFAEQNTRLKADVGVSALNKNVGKKEFWEVMIKAMTAPIK